MKIRLNNHLNGFFFKSKMQILLIDSAICKMNADSLNYNPLFLWRAGIIFAELINLKRIKLC